MQISCHLGDITAEQVDAVRAVRKRLAAAPRELTGRELATRAPFGEEALAIAELARELSVPLISNQPQYSMLWRVIEPQVVPASEREGLGQIVWSPIAQGVLTGKYLPGQQPPAGSRATDEGGGSTMISRWLRDEVLNGVQQLKPIAADLGLSQAQLAVAWVLQNPNVSAAIVGASRPEQVSDNVKAVGVTLDRELLDRIDEVLDPVVQRDPALTQSPNRADLEKRD